MSRLLESDVRNRLLKTLSAEDFARLAPHLRRRPAALHEMLIASDAPITHLFFPESGFVSITTPGTRRLTEIGLIGFEGLAGVAPILLGSATTPFPHIVQSAGEVLEIGKDDLAAACHDSPSLNTLLLRFVHTLIVQTAQTAFVNATFDIAARLARWLLMCQDRLRMDELALTHEYLGVMLGVQRTSVTLTLQTLEGHGLIRARRGRVEIRSRTRLIDAAEGGYGLPEAEYMRLIGSA